MCDEIAIINHGEVIARDKTANLVGRMDAKTLVITPETAPGDLSLPEGVEVTRQPGGTLHISYHRSVTSADAILEALRMGGVQIRDVSTREPDLEDVFLDLTRAQTATG